MPLPPYNRPLHVLAILTGLATFPLIFMGGLVTTLGAGMSVPDWPNSYGYNMFLFPPNQWVGGILYEHTHRLMGTVVGFLAISLALCAWGPAERPTARKGLGIATLLLGLSTFVLGMMLIVIKGAQIPDVAQVASNASHTFVGSASLLLICLVAWRCRRRDPRPAVRWLRVAVLVAICLQGIIGGYRVLLVKLGLAMIHGCIAQAVFCLIGFAAFRTGPNWDRVKQESFANTAGGRRLAWIALLAVGAIYGQLIVGVIMRHNDAGLAIADVPLAYGKLLPPTDAAGVDAANLWRANTGEADLRPVTLTQIWLHFGHRIGATVVSLVLLGLIATALSGKGFGRVVGVPTGLVALFLTLQVSLGILTVLYRKPADIASLHVAVGALLLLTTFLLASRAVRAFGLLQSETRFQPVPETANQSALRTA